MSRSFVALRRVGVEGSGDPDWVVLNEGFSALAFAFPLPWLLFNRLWGRFALALVTTIAAVVAVAWGVAPGAALPVALLAIAAVVAFEGPRWRIVSRETRGFRACAVVTARTRSEAEDRVALIASALAP